MADATGNGPTGDPRPAAHVDHDPLQVAEAADRAGALPPALADCPECRALHADLVALAAAVPTAALPARPRAYTLTPADAARLRAPVTRVGAGEPPVERARLTHDMIDPRSPRSAAHADHDPLLVAAAADRAAHLPPALADCPDCVDLHADLVALAAAVPTAALPARPRAYTLTPADADRLRAPWRRWLGAIGTSRDAITKPLAVSFTTIGLAGLLVATVPGALTSGGATDSVTGEAASSAPLEPAMAPAPSAAAATSDTTSIEAPELQGGEDGNGVFSGSDDGDAAASADAGSRNATEGAQMDAFTLGEDDTGLSTLVVIAGMLLIAGLGLFGLRWTARRLSDG